ncbi:MAG: TylF/MycF/NovP-related O-methyltransferase, partial [bacterium]
MSDSSALYLDLLKLCLTNFINGASEQKPVLARRRLKRRIVSALAARGIQMVRPTPFDPALRAEGRDWPPNADSMIGLKRLDNLQFCVEDVLARKVPGDLIETGVWRGGATILMRAVLKAHGVS